jgi:hypothetical protein
MRRTNRVASFGFTAPLNRIAKMRAARFALLVASAALLSLAQTVSGAILAPPYSLDYTLVDLGAADNVPTNYSTLVVNPNNTNQLLVGGSANGPSAVIDRVTVTRDINGHITGFVPNSTQQVSTASSGVGGIDGGLQYGPGGVLFFTSYSDNHLGEIKPGSTTPDKFINLTAAGVASSTGSLAFVPNGFANAGHLKITSYNGGGIYDTTISPDGSGTYDIAQPVTPGPNTGAGPEGLAFIRAGNADFPANSLLIAEYGAGRVSAYLLDANSDPILASRTDFITGLSGASGATIDPVTGDFLFDTFGGGNHVIEVRGFVAVPEPASIVLIGAGAATLLLGIRRRSRPSRSALVD